MATVNEDKLHIPSVLVGEAIEETIDWVEATSTGKPPPAPLRRSWMTGFSDLDALTGGLHPGLVHLVFGKPGVGTSTFALNCAQHVSAAGGRVLLLSAQSPRREVVLRLLAAEAKVPLQNLRRALMREDDWTRLVESIASLAERPLSIVDRPYRDLATVLSSDLFDQRWDLVVVDGVQLFTRATAPESLWAAHTRVAGDVKRAAAGHDTAFLLTVSTNRRPSQRADMGLGGPLTLPDIASSNAHAAEADIVIGVHREDQDEPESPRAGEADLIVMKNRYGPRDTSVVAFQGHYARFVNIAAG